MFKKNHKPAALSVVRIEQLCVKNGVIEPVKNELGTWGYAVRFHLSDGSEFYSFMPASMLPNLPGDWPEEYKLLLGTQAMNFYHLGVLAAEVSAGAAYGCLLNVCSALYAAEGQRIMISAQLLGMADDEPEE